MCPLLRHLHRGKRGEKSYYLYISNGLGSRVIELAFSATSTYDGLAETAIAIPVMERFKVIELILPAEFYR